MLGIVAGVDEEFPPGIPLENHVTFLSGLVILRWENQAMNPINNEQAEAFRRLLESDTQEIPIVTPIRPTLLPRLNSSGLQPLLKVLHRMVERQRLRKDD